MTRCLDAEAIKREGRAIECGAFVEVEQLTSFARALALVDDPPDCPLSTERLAANGTPIDGYPRQQA